MKIRMASLNEKQRRAVESVEAAVLLAGGAGTGKTHVVAMRAAHLVDGGHARPESILVLCPGLAAARDMDDRLLSLLGSRRAVEGMRIATMGGTAVDFLREHFDWWDPVAMDTTPHAPAEDFALCDDATAALLLKEVLPESGLQGRRDELLRAVQSTKRRLVDQPVLPGTESPLERLAQSYRLRMREQRLLDRDELLLACIRMWENLPELAEVMRRRHRHVLVDDVEELDELELRWLKLLLGADPRLFAVGDPDQSLAEHHETGAEVLLHLARAYPGALRIRLEQNYRSTSKLLRGSEGILAAANRPIRGRTWTEDEEGRPISILELRDGSAEAHVLPVLVDRILNRLTAPADDAGPPTSPDGGDEDDELEELVAEGPDEMSEPATAEGRELDLEDVAVLLADPELGLPLERAFLNAGMPCRRFGETHFYERSEIRDLLAYLSVIANPRDGISFRRMLELPRRGLGDRTAEAILRHGRRKELIPEEALADLVTRRFLPASALDEGKRLLAFLSRMRSLFASTPLPEAFETLLDESDLRREMERSTNASRRRASLAEFARRLAFHEGATPPDGLRRFLTEVALTRGRDAWRPGEPAVSLMPIAMSRDLEWPVVILVGADRAEEGDEDESNVGGPPTDRERRRLHVVLSRARQELWILHARERLSWGRLRARRPWAVLAELPEDCVSFAVPPWARRFTRSRQRHRAQRLAPGQLTLFPVSR